MSRLIKEKIVGKYQSRFQGVADVAVVSTKGVDVQRMTAFRGALRGKGIRAMTIHNRLGKRALDVAGLTGISTLLHGPSTLVWGGDSIVDLAKVLADQAKTLKEMEIRGGVSGGQVLSKADFEVLSKMPSRQELVGQVAGRIIGQAARVAALVLAMGGRLAAQVREIEKKAAPPPAAETPPAAPPAEGAAPAAEGAAAPAEGAAAPAAPAAAAPKTEIAAPGGEAPKAGEPPKA